MVRDMKWCADGSKICICYEDGIGASVFGRVLPSLEALAHFLPCRRVSFAPLSSLGCQLGCVVDAQMHTHTHTSIYPYMTPYARTHTHTCAHKRHLIYQFHALINTAQLFISGPLLLWQIFSKISAPGKTLHETRL